MEITEEQKERIRRATQFEARLIDHVLLEQLHSIVYRGKFCEFIPS